MSCFVIAELGTNWRNLNEADELIKLCADAGATACKFQAYKFFREYNPVNNHLNSVILKPDTIPYLYWRCANAGVELIVTPMYPDAVKMIDPYVKRWKIRHMDRKNMDIQDLCKKTGKEILLSTEEPFTTTYPYKFLYCCPQYPPKDYPTVKEFEGMRGYSCHIPVVDHITYAVNRFNLDYLEVHVKKNEYLDGYCPIDNSVSITVDELKDVVDGIN